MIKVDQSVSVEFRKEHNFPAIVNRDYGYFIAIAAKQNHPAGFTLVFALLLESALSEKSIKC